MEEISFNGEKYVKASVVADKFGYTSDYVGQLCRGKQVKATLVGRSWYVNEDSVRDHKKGRHRSSLAKSKQSVRKVITDKTHKPPSTPRYLGRVAKYEDDSSDLFPTVKKEREKAGLVTDRVQTVNKREDKKYVEKSSHVTNPDGNEKVNKTEYHPAVRIVRSTKRTQGAQKTAPARMEKVTPNRKSSEFKKQRKSNNVKLRKSKFSSVKIFSLGVSFFMVLIFFLGSVFLEKKIQVEENSIGAVKYTVSIDSFYEIYTNFLSTYFKF